MNGNILRDNPYPGSCTTSRNKGRFMTDSSSNMSTEYEPPKKKRVRARLDHLTPHEKLQRRKQKNRVAAQTARDRKRAKIDHLEEENRKLREENEHLKSQLKMSVTSSSVAPLSNLMVDSGVSDNESVPKISASASMADGAEMDLLTVPQQHCCPSPGSSTSGAYSASPMPDDNNNQYIDSVVGETDETSLINDILQLQESIFSGSGNEASVESAELINVPQQRVQEASFQSPSVENSAGWTSIQLMLLLMIWKVHRLYSWKTNCCVTTRDGLAIGTGAYNNLYDYILQTKCMDFRRAAEAIIAYKNNVRQQRLVSLEFVHRYLYNNRLQHSSWAT